MINLHTKFEISVFTHYEDMKLRQRKYRNWSGLGVRDRPVSLAMSEFDNAYMSSYWTLIETVRLSLLYRFRVIASCQKSPILTYPTCIWCPRWGGVRISPRS